MKNVKKILAIVLAISLVLPIFSLTAKATSIGSTNSSDEPLTTLRQHKEGIANEKYNILLKHWAYDKTYPNDEYAYFPSFYGGAYIDEDKNLVIQLTSLDASYIEYFKGLIDLEDVVFEKVEFSYARLVAEKDAAVAKMAAANDKYADTITGIGISIPKNSVNIYINLGEAKNKGFATETVCESVSKFDRINVIETSGRDQPAAIAYPGDRINVEQSTTLPDRSLGFWARNSNGELGIVTAPHANLHSGDEIYIGGVKFGEATTPYYSGSVDAVFIKRTQISFTASRTVPGHNVSHVSGTYSNLAVGTTSYSRGRVSGHKTGTVHDINYTTGYGINSCVVTTAPCQNGDSGGIVMGRENNSMYVVGIVTGTQGGTGYLIYTKASFMMSKLRCTVY